MSILVCYDGSGSATEALEVVAATLASNEVTLLHVWNPPVAVLADAFSDPGIVIQPGIDELERLGLERASEIAAAGEDAARGLGLSVTTEVRRNETTVWQTILDAAAAHESRLIVIGTRGRTAVQTALLGSVSNAVVHHSTIPVLVVPTPGA
jgi:nucleotide-binding universal stress UspA family protein